MKLLASLLILAAVAPMGSVCRAQTAATWLLPGDGRYDEPANWSTGQVPGASCCTSTTAEFDAVNQADVYLPSGGTFTPDGIKVTDSKVSLTKLTGAAESTVAVTQDLLIDDGGMLGVGDELRLDSPQTRIGVGSTATELSLFAGAVGDLGSVSIGGDGVTGADSSMIVWPGAEVGMGPLTVGENSADGQASILQVEGQLTQSPGSSTKVGGGLGVSRVFVRASGELQLAGPVEVFSMGGFVNAGGSVTFAGDVDLLGGTQAYRETPGSGAARAFAANSSITVGEGSVAAFDSAPLLLNDGHTLVLSGEVEARGDVVTASGTDLVVRLDQQRSSPALDAQGQVTLGGGLTVEWPEASPDPTPGASWRLIAAAGGLGGQFDSVALPWAAGVSWQLDYEPDGVRLTALAAAVGDYNSDGVVDAADYTVWRDTLGSGLALNADGDGSGMVDIGDYLTWRSAMQAAAATGASAAPEPAAVMMAAIAMLLPSWGFLVDRSPGRA
ncbi:MAG: hypothetical protein AAGJ46_14095 [Planctomycetota bacterium]